MESANGSRHDVVVVGGRVAGSATAMLLAHLGHDVVIVDQACFPSDTVSTHSIARSGVVQLRRWGLVDEVLASGAPAIRQVTFNAAGESTRRTIKDKAGVDFMVAPRRYLLDTLLASAAEHAGAELHTGITVTGLQRDGDGRVVGVSGHDRTGDTQRRGDDDGGDDIRQHVLEHDPHVACTEGTERLDVLELPDDEHLRANESRHPCPADDPDRDEDDA